MDTTNGRIISAENQEKLAKALAKDFEKIHGHVATEEELEETYVEIDEADMTEKQLETKQVSKYDSISVLGRQFTGNRKRRREQATALKAELKRKK